MDEDLRKLEQEMKELDTFLEKNGLTAEVFSLSVCLSALSSTCRMKRSTEIIDFLGIADDIDAFETEIKPAVSKCMSRISRKIAKFIIDKPYDAAGFIYEITVGGKK